MKTFIALSHSARYGDFGKTATKSALRGYVRAYIKMYIKQLEK